MLRFLPIAGAEVRWIVWAGAGKTAPRAAAPATSIRCIETPSAGGRSQGGSRPDWLVLQSEGVTLQDFPCREGSSGWRRGARSQGRVGGVRIPGTVVDHGGAPTYSGGPSEHFE